MAESKYAHKILIVEDDQAMLDALVDNLKLNGFEKLVTAQNGQEGLDAAFRENPDLILLDIVLPKLDGMQVLKKLRSDARGKTIKVILLTNLNVTDSILTGIVSNEPSYYLVKAEHSIDEVIDKVKSVLGV